MRVGWAAHRHGKTLAHLVQVITEAKLSEDPKLEIVVLASDDYNAGWNEAIEAAAKVLDRIRAQDLSTDEYWNVNHTAKEIRALKREEK